MEAKAALELESRKEGPEALLYNTKQLLEISFYYLPQDSQSSQRRESKVELAFIFANCNNDFLRSDQNSPENPQATL